MTAIVAIQAGDRVIIGADSLGVDQGFERELRRDDKIFRAGPNNEYVIGYSTSYRGGQILRYHVPWPEFPDVVTHEEALAFFVSKIVPAVQNTIERYWLNRQPDDLIDFIIATGRWFARISSDMQVAQLYDYAAIGSGAPYALGALAILTASHEVHYLGGFEEAVRKALKASEKHNAGVAGPFILLST